MIKSSCGRERPRVLGVSITQLALNGGRRVAYRQAVDVVPTQALSDLRPEGLDPLVRSRFTGLVRPRTHLTCHMCGNQDTYIDATGTV
jgi:hypothetical protein